MPSRPLIAILLVAALVVAGAAALIVVLPRPATTSAGVPDHGSATTPTGPVETESVRMPARRAYESVGFRVTHTVVRRGRWVPDE